MLSVFLFAAPLGMSRVEEWLAGQDLGVWRFSSQVPLNAITISPLSLFLANLSYFSVVNMCRELWTKISKASFIPQLSNGHWVTEGFKISDWLSLKTSLTFLVTEYTLLWKQRGDVAKSVSKATTDQWDQFKGGWKLTSHSPLPLYFWELELQPLPQAPQEAKEVWNAPLVDWHDSVFWSFAEFVEGKEWSKTGLVSFQAKHWQSNTAKEETEKKRGWDINWLIKLPLHAPVTDVQATSGLPLCLLF